MRIWGVGGWLLFGVIVFANFSGRIFLQTPTIFFTAKITNFAGFCNFRRRKSRRKNPQKFGRNIFTPIFTKAAENFYADFYPLLVGRGYTQVVVVVVSSSSGSSSSSRSSSGGSSSGSSDSSSGSSSKG